MSNVHVLHGSDVGGCEVLCLEAMKVDPGAVLITGDTTGPLGEALSIAASEVVTVPGLSLRSPLAWLRSLLKLRGLRSREGVRRVFFWHGRRQLLPSLAAAAVAFPRARPVIHIGTVVESLTKSERAQLAIARGLHLLRTATFVCPNANVMSSARAIARPGQLVAIPNAVRAPELHANEQPQGYRRVVMIARFDNSKDHVGVIRAVDMLSERAPELKVLFVGEGPLRPAVELETARLALTDRVEFAGAQVDPWERVSPMDVFVFAVHPREGFGLALAEALLADLRVVSSDVPAAAPFRNQPGILLYPYGSVESLAEQLIAAFGLPTGYERSHASLGLTTSREMMDQYCIAADA